MGEVRSMAMIARFRGLHGLAAVVLVALVLAHSTVEADDVGPEPIQQNEDSPAGGPFETAMTEKHATALSQKKSYEQQGGVEGIKHGGQLVKKWLKEADAKYKEDTDPTPKADVKDEDGDPDQDGKDDEAEDKEKQERDKIEKTELEATADTAKK